MTPEYWQKVKEIVADAVAAALEDRAKVIKNACGSDDELRREVESLLEFEDGCLPDEPAGQLDDEAVDHSHAFIGKQIGKYTIVDVIAAGGMGTVYLAERGENWEWFEDRMTYDNARLSEALIRAGMALHDDESIAIGLRTFAFYVSVTVENGIYVPIGNDGWYVRGGERARYAQQPLEATALIDAAHAAFDATGDPAYSALARVGLEWFYGRNSRTMLLARGGGCCDGLDESGVNLNMGAESTLAFLAAAYSLADREPAALRVAR